MCTSPALKCPIKALSPYEQSFWITQIPGLWEEAKQLLKEGCDFISHLQSTPAIASFPFPRYMVGISPY